MRRHKAEPTGTFSVGHRRRSLSDPLAAALRPPKDETPEQRERRLNDEQEAKRVSDGIDEMIRAEKKEKRVKQEVKVLLLGQSESGKSTTLKRESDPYSAILRILCCIGVVSGFLLLDNGYYCAAYSSAALASSALHSPDLIRIPRVY